MLGWHERFQEHSLDRASIPGSLVNSGRASGICIYHFSHNSVIYHPPGGFRACTECRFGTLDTTIVYNKPHSS